MRNGPLGEKRQKRRKKMAAPVVVVVVVVAAVVAQLLALMKGMRLTISPPPLRKRKELFSLGVEVNRILRW